MMTVIDDEHELIEACRAGRIDAFGTLVGRYQDRLYPTALRLTGRPEDASDLLQDAFLRAFEKLSKFKGESSFYTWVYRITVNLALSEKRRGKVAGRRRESISIEPTDFGFGSDPTRAIEDAERDRKVQGALDTLAPQHRAVIVMKEFDGLRYEEIADLIGIPVGTVRSRLHRARAELRELLLDVVDLDLLTHQSTESGDPS